MRIIAIGCEYTGKNHPFRRSHAVGGATGASSITWTTTSAFPTARCSKTEGDQRIMLGSARSH